MTKSKLKEPMDKTNSSYRKKINVLNKSLRIIHKGIERRNKQIKLDYKFKQILREKYPKIYWEIVEKLQKDETLNILNDKDAMKSINLHKARKGDYSNYIPLKDLTKKEKE